MTLFVRLLCLIHGTLDSVSLDQEHRCTHGHEAALHRLSSIERLIAK